MFQFFFIVCFQVNFIISGSTVANRRRLRNNNQQTHSRIDELESQLYRDLAQTSGGQAAEVATGDLTEAINILIESTSASLVASPRSDYQFSRLQDFTRHLFLFNPQVTLLQAARNPGKTDDFTFRVDETVVNPAVFITGRSITYTLTSPTGNTRLKSLLKRLLVSGFSN